jgi:small-conductance mechanosensitive channel
VDFDDISHWARGQGLEALLIALGAVLLARVTRFTANRLVERSTDRDERSDENLVVSSEATKYRGALVQGVAWAAVFLIYFIAVMLILVRLNVPITTLVAPATLIGAAIGFGSQRLVQDVLSGFFLISERQYGFGDVVRIAPPGSAVGVSGTVEELTLRTTRMRTEDGELVIIANGEVRQVTNRSKEWARIVLDIPLALDADVPKATAILRKIGKEIWEDDEWTPLLLDAPTVMGIQSFGVGFLKLRFVARTLPGKQWEVGRELRNRIADAFRESDIAAPLPGVVATQAVP